MNLKEQLAELKEQNLSQIPEDIQAIMFGDLKQLEDSGIVDKAPKNGEKIIDFNLPNHIGETRSLAELREKGPVVITFYRGGWCPYCNLELRAYQAVLEDIKAAGATLVAITPELPDSSLSTSEKHNLGFEVLTDEKSDYARELGLVFTLSEKVRPVYEQFGIEVEKHNGKGQFDLPLAATLVVDVDGTVACAAVAVDYTQRAEPADVVKELQNLKRN